MTSSPTERANSLILGGAGRPDLPLGLSGWVTTKPTSSLSVNAAKLGTAASGVPKKTIRLTPDPALPLGVLSTLPFGRVSKAGRAEDVRLDGRPRVAEPVRADHPRRTPPELPLYRVP